MKRITASTIGGFLLAGFIILSVFGIGSFTNVQGESILACVTKSVGMISCSQDGASLPGMVHEGSAFDALLNAIVLLAVFVAISLAVVFIFTLKDFVINFVPVLERVVVLNVGLSRLKSWISLFELSPGK